MCFPEPGPRCSYHAHKEYLVALKRYEDCLEPEKKLILGEILEEKTDVYYSTPRGQNFLRREADHNTGYERDRYLLLLSKAEKVREKQVQDYQSTIANKDSRFKDKTLELGRKVSKYGVAAGLTLLFIKEHLPDSKARIVSKDTIELSPGRLLLVLPPKYQGNWGRAKQSGEVFETDSEVLAEVLNSSINLNDLSSHSLDNTIEWFSQVLTDSGYIGIASVNPTTQDVAIYDIHNLEDTYDFSLKLSKRLGGTTSYAGDVETVEKSLIGTVFGKGKVVQVGPLKKTIVLGVPPQPKALCSVSDEFYLGWHAATEEGYFEVRRKHISNTYDVVVKLRVKRRLFASGLSPEVRTILNGESITPTTRVGACD